MSVTIIFDIELQAAQCMNNEQYWVIVDVYEILYTYCVNYTYIQWRILLVGYNVHNEQRIIKKNCIHIIVYMSI